MRRSQPWSIMCALNETQTPQHQHNEAWFISVSHLVRFSGFHTPRRTSKKYYQSWIGSLHLRLSPLSYTLFRFLFIRRSSLNNLRTKKKKKNASKQNNDKSDFFSCIVHKKYPKTEIHSYPHTLAADSDHSFFTCTICFIFEMKLYASCIWSPEDWWARSFWDSFVITWTISLKEMPKSPQTRNRTHFGFGREFICTESCFGNYHGPKEENARCRQLINPSFVSPHIINYKVSKCDLSSEKQKKKTSVGEAKNNLLSSARK